LIETKFGQPVLDRFDTLTKQLLRKIFRFRNLELYEVDVFQPVMRKFTRMSPTRMMTSVRDESGYISNATMIKFHFDPRSDDMASEVRISCSPVGTGNIKAGVRTHPSSKLVDFARLLARKQDPFEYEERRRLKYSGIYTGAELENKVNAVFRHLVYRQALPQDFRQ